MGKAQVLLIALTALAAISLYNLADNAEPQKETMFNIWMNEYGKVYADVGERTYRMGVWLENYAYVQKHNARHAAGQETYSLEMNEFADMPSEEFGQRYLMTDYKYEMPEVTSKCTGKQAPSTSLPDSVDWATKGAVTPIKNQGQCGSCWAFSTTGSVEGANFLSKKSLSSFSEQQLVDCSHSYGNNGCQGGLMDYAFYYIIDNGITLESKYTYKGIQGKCAYTDADKAASISDCTDVTVNSEKALMAAINQQPVSVAIQANHLSFQLYKKGVYTGNCGTNLDHGVLAVGYGTDSGKDYFKVKNSWGAGWGNDGYIWIQRTGDGKGKCGIQMAASFPIA